MKATSRLIFIIAMMIFTVVSMCTTYISLSESMLPKPIVNITFGPGSVWSCSVLALGMSVAIGLMLFALKIAIIDEHKRLNLFGVVGLVFVGFISIAFNIDVFYRAMEQDFMIRHSTDTMRGAYEDFLVEAQAKLQIRREEAMKIVAKQEGELEAEIKGLREAPAGYGPRAREEDHQLTIMSKQAEVDLVTVNEAIAVKQEADALLASALPKTVDDIQTLQNELRVKLKDVAAIAGIPLPEAVATENPLFAVFNRVFDFSRFGAKEGCVIFIALLLDLGDIIGYTMVPDQKKKKTKEPVDKPVTPHVHYKEDPIVASLPTSLPTMSSSEMPFELAPLDHRDPD
ncbi:MAG: hypothetical protein AMXMBFR84_12100 [Candidatus Hydrogenedentota bacterium]